MIWKCPPLNLFNWSNYWKWKDDMRTKPKGVMATFKITKTYYVTVDGDTEGDCFSKAENLLPSDIKEEDFGDMEIELHSGFEYASF
jgi:hypothetical protein